MVLAGGSAVLGLLLGLSLLTATDAVDPEAYMDAVSAARAIFFVIYRRRAVCFIELGVRGSNCKKNSSSYS